MPCEPHSPSISIASLRVISSFSAMGKEPDELWMRSLKNSREIMPTSNGECHNQANKLWHNKSWGEKGKLEYHSAKLGKDNKR
jgi:hypothetical protein